MESLRLGFQSWLCEAGDERSRDRMNANDTSQSGYLTDLAVGLRDRSDPGQG